MTHKQLSAELHTIYDDMVEAYKDARLNENVPGQERLAKVIQQLSKQIKEHELHEKAVIHRDAAIRYATDICSLMGSILKKYDGQTFDASEAIIEIVFAMEEHAESLGD